MGEIIDRNEGECRSEQRRERIEREQRETEGRLRENLEREIREFHSSIQPYLPSYKSGIVWPHPCTHVQYNCNPNSNDLFIASQPCTHVQYNCLASTPCTHVQYNCNPNKL